MTVVCPKCSHVRPSLERRQKASEGDGVAVAEEERESGAGVAVANAALQVSGADAGMLSDLSAASGLIDLRRDDSVLSNQHRLLGEDTGHRALG